MSRIISWYSQNFKHACNLYCIDIIQYRRQVWLIQIWVNIIFLSKLWTTSLYLIWQSDCKKTMYHTSSFFELMYHTSDVYKLQNVQFHGQSCTGAHSRVVEPTMLGPNMQDPVYIVLLRDNWGGHVCLLFPLLFFWMKNEQSSSHYCLGPSIVWTHSSSIILFSK
jgi:hypothetical protein